MNKYAILQTIKRLYDKEGINIIQYLKELDNRKNNCLEDVMISYDFQAGTYVNGYVSNPAGKHKFLSRLVKILTELPGRKRTIFEPGVGEATTLVPLVKKLGNGICAGGGDISWSRVKVGQRFAFEHCDTAVKMPTLIMADMFSLPFKDDSVDVVYTVHALEPNGGHEVELLQELYRVTREYLILLEPAYELAGPEAKERMERHGYVRTLYQSAKSLGYNILEWELYGESVNPMNPTGLLVIQKCSKVEKPEKLHFACPITRTQLEPLGNVFYSRDSLLAYPILNDVPCLIKDYAVVATKMVDFI